MDELNLRALAAPLESLRKGVEAAYKVLDAKWHAVASQLEALPIPCDVHCVIRSDDCGNWWEHLEWRKHKAKRRICFVSYWYGQTVDGVDEHESVLPYDEWSAELRLKMLEHVPELFKSAEVQVRDFINKATKES